MTAVTEKRTQVYLTEAQHRAAMELARRRGVSLAAVVRAAIDSYLAQQRSGQQIQWEGSPALELIGGLDLPPLGEGEDLNEAIDRSVYAQETSPWYSQTARDSSQRSTPGTKGTGSRQRRGKGSRGRGRGS